MRSCAKPAGTGPRADLRDLYRQHRPMGRYRQSAAQQMRALTLARQIGNHCAEAMALMRLGVVDCNRGRYEQALAHTQEALSVGRQIGDLGGPELSGQRIQ
jgi:hypothetical protein